MPYLFAALVLLNIVMLGYYIFVPQNHDSKQFKEMQASISQPLEFNNSAEHLQPIIGSKD